MQKLKSYGFSGSAGGALACFAMMIAVAVQYGMDHGPVILHDGKERSHPD